MSSSVSSSDGDDTVPLQQEVNNRLRNWLQAEKMPGQGNMRRPTISIVQWEYPSGGGKSNDVPTFKHDVCPNETCTDDLEVAASTCPLPPEDAARAVKKIKRRIAHLIALQQSTSGAARGPRQGRPQSFPRQEIHPRTRGPSGLSSTPHRSRLASGVYLAKLRAATRERQEDANGNAPRSTTFRPNDVRAKNVKEDETDVSQTNSQSGNSSHSGHDRSRRHHQSGGVKLLNALILLGLSGWLLWEQHTLCQQPPRWEFLADGSVPFDLNWPFRVTRSEVEMIRGWQGVSAAITAAAAVLMCWGALTGHEGDACKGLLLAVVAFVCDFAPLLCAGAILLPTAGVIGTLSAVSGPAAELQTRFTLLALTILFYMFKIYFVPTYTHN